MSSQNSNTNYKIVALCGLLGGLALGGLALTVAKLLGVF